MQKLLNVNDINFIELFLASDIKLVRYQVSGMQHDPGQMHQLVSQAISSMIFKLRAFIEKSSQADTYLTNTQQYDKEAQTRLNEEAKKIIQEGA